MTIFDAQSIPDEVRRSTMDREIAEWLKGGPVLSAHKPLHVQRREHDAFIDEVKPTDDGDWLTLARAARTVTRERVEDYIAAATAAGPLVPDTGRPAP